MQRRKKNCFLYLIGNSALLARTFECMAGDKSVNEIDCALHIMGESVENKV